MYWLPPSDSQLSFSQLLKLPKLSHGTACTILVAFLPFLPTAVTQLQPPARFPRCFPGWRRDKDLMLYSGLQRHGTTLRASELLLLWLPKSGKSSRLSISCFLWGRFWTTLHCKRIAQGLQKRVKSKWKGNNAICVRKINSSQNWMKKTQHKAWLHWIEFLAFHLPSLLLLTAPLLQPMWVWEICWHLGRWGEQGEKKTTSSCNNRSI